MAFLVLPSARVDSGMRRSPLASSVTIPELEAAAAMYNNCGGRRRMRISPSCLSGGERRCPARTLGENTAVCSGGKANIHSQTLAVPGSVDFFPRAHGAGNWLWRRSSGQSAADLGACWLDFGPLPNLLASPKTDRQL